MIIDKVARESGKAMELATGSLTFALDELAMIPSSTFSSRGGSWMRAPFPNNHDQIQLCEQLYREAKTISGDLGWELRQFEWRLYREFDVPGHGERLALVGQYREDEGEVYLALYFRKKFPIRKLHFHFDHYNPPDCPTCPDEMMNGLHKHYATADHVNTAVCAYEPTDVSATDPNTMTRAFLEECNIELDGDYHPLLL